MSELKSSSQFCFPPKDFQSECAAILNRQSGQTLMSQAAVWEAQKSSLEPNTDGTKISSIILSFGKTPH